MKSIFLLSLSLLLFSCNKQQESSGGQYKENISLVATVEKNDGQLAPNFYWYNETGAQVSFADAAKGKAVLINFWATWCGPCIKEIPDLIELSKEFESRGGLVIGISVDKDSDVLTLVSDFAKDKNMKYPIVIDNGDIEKAFGGLRGIPTTFIINKEGKIVNKLIGLRSKEVFAQELTAAL